MRLKEHIENKYIGMKEKNNKPKQYPDKVKSILKRLNTILERNSSKTDYIFDIVSENEFISPSEIIKFKSKKRFENVMKEWIILCEKFEQIKEEFNKGLQNKE